EDEELPDQMEGNITENYEPEAVLAVRKIKQQGEESKQLLVQWRGKTVEEATWEDEIMIRSQFPPFNLEGKVDFEGGSIDRAQNKKEVMTRDQLVYHEAKGPKTWLVYYRREMEDSLL
ncbi:RNA-directed DNA polymerase (Reverse transcriptase), partial [Trifolium medium]|nr:RNA-directed DNA polymerase (Reverse transcriptase) [Trifolium medium]